MSDIIYLENEIWKPVAGYDGLYEIINTGRVKYPCKKIKRYWRGRHQTFRRKEKITVGHVNRKGYLEIKLQKGAIKKPCRVHRLVAQAFIPNPNNLPQINHKDGDKKNNKATNLEWCDNSHNIKHAYENRLMDRRGEKQNTCKIKESDVLEIRDFYSKNPTAFLRVYAEKLNITRNTVSNIIKRNIWKHI